MNLLRRIQDVGLIHRDIKLDNILLESADIAIETRLVLIDFGLSTMFLTDKDTHMTMKDEEIFVGNQIFASRRAMSFKSKN